MKTLLSTRFSADWASKFPYASHRIQEFNATHVAQDSQHASQSNYDPTFYDGVISTPRPKMALMSGISTKHGGVKTDKVQRVNMEEIEAQTAKAALKRIFDTVETPDDSSIFTTRYNKFLNQVSHFNKAGGKWTQPNGFLVKVRELKLLDNYPKFEEWILTGKPSQRHMNWIHETWMTTGLTRRMMSESQKIRIGHWITIFFQHTSFKRNRPLVSSFTLLRIQVVKTKINFFFFRLKPC